jgi:ATP-dependent Clp protease adaptor protein ClpS
MGAMVSNPTRRREVGHAEVTEEELAPLYHLVLLDDDQHTYEYVIEMLGSIFGYGAQKAWALARMVDTQGRVILETAPRERCEMHQGQIHAYGADPRIPTSVGSMTAILEEAGTPDSGG